MADQAHEWTDEQIDDLAKRMWQAYSQAANEMQDKLEAWLEDFDRKNKAWKRAVDVDGDWRGQTSAGIQRYLKAHGFDCGPVDGYFGSESVKALCQSLDKAPQIWR